MYAATCATTLLRRTTSLNEIADQIMQEDADLRETVLRDNVSLSSCHRFSCVNVAGMTSPNFLPHNHTKKETHMSALKRITKVVIIMSLAVW